MTIVLTALGWAVMLPILIAIARAEMRGDGVLRFREDAE